MIRSAPNSIGNLGSYLSLYSSALKHPLNDECTRLVLVRETGKEQWQKGTTGEPSHAMDDRSETKCKLCRTTAIPTLGDFGII